MTNSTAELVHERSAEILCEVGFCVPLRDLAVRLEAAGFPVDRETQMVRVTAELLDAALKRLPRDVLLYDRNGETPAPFGRTPSFMGAGTPVNVLDLGSGARRSATHQDVRDLVTLQDALPQVDIVRPTVTATDQGEASDLVEIAELLRCTGKPVVHRTLAAERVEAAVEMLVAVAGGEDAFRARPNFATLYCPISPGYFTPENIACRFPLARAWIVDILPQAAETYAAELGDELGLPVEAVLLEERETVVRQADMIFTVTTGAQPLVERSWLRPGAFVARLGSYQEIALDVITQADKVIVDSWGYVRPRIPELKILAHDGRFGADDVHAEWPDVVAGKRPGRESPDEVIVYIALGIWGEYAAILPEVYRRARTIGLGRQLT